jgi:hypothetical protein
MAKKRDDGEMSFKPKDETKSGNGGAQGPSDGMPRKERKGDGGALGPDQGTARGDAINPDNGATHAHAEHGGGKQSHSSHMPNC